LEAEAHEDKNESKADVVAKPDAKKSKKAKKNSSSSQR